MSLVLSPWEAHFANQHQCCRIADPTRYRRCGLWCGHDGDHVPYTPGDYLQPPLLHPLDRIRLLFLGDDRCPLCGAWAGFQPWSSRVTGWTCTVEPRRRQLPRGPSAYIVSKKEWRWEHRFQFDPCGCVGVEMLE